ncbi:MAG: phage major capsid protein [Bacteroidales bacterium]|nr:phage major capsid protein [Bacteroidales bacterium]
MFNKVRIQKNAGGASDIEQLRQAVVELTNLVKSASLTPEQAQALVADAVAKARSNTVEFPVAGADAGGGEISAMTGEAALVNDYLFIGKSVLGGSFNPKTFLQKMAQSQVVDFVAINKFQQVAKAMDSQTQGDGAEWVPGGFSSELIRELKLQLKVAALHRRINMPTNPYTFPVAGVDAVAYLASEATIDAQAKFKASTPGSGTGITFVAKKLAARVLASEELTEDSIVPILPFLRDQIVTALATAEETATINGQPGPAPHMDVDVIAADDARRSWNGYRALVQPGPAGAFVDLGADWNVEGVRSVRTAMGKYGVDPSKLAYVTSIVGYFKLLDIKDAAGNSPIMTLDKYGTNATILTGELAKFDNIPIIVSEHVRANLNAQGVFDGVTMDKTELITVYRPGMVYGDRRQVRVRTKEDFETEQIIIVGSQRVDFHPLVTPVVGNYVGIGYNI